MSVPAQDLDGFLHPVPKKISGPWSPAVRANFDVSLLQDLYDGLRRRAFIAEDFMRRRAVVGTVLVVGEGPLAAGVVEHALRCGATNVIWTGRPLDMVSVFVSTIATLRYIDHIGGSRSSEHSDI